MKYKLIVADMDGVFWKGRETIAAAVETANNVLAQGCKLVYFTNNSTKLPQQYAERLRDIGVKLADAADIVTSGTAAADYLYRSQDTKKHPAKVLCLAARALEVLLRQKGIRVISKEHYKEADYVLLGELDSYHPDIGEYIDRQLLENAVNSLIFHGARLVATNPDVIDPAEGGEVRPVAGALLAYVNACVNEAIGEQAPSFVVIGKPEKHMLESAAIAGLKLPKEQILIVGDTLKTDILVGVRNGIDTALVLGGNNSEADIARLGIKPSYVVSALPEILDLG